MRPLRLRLRNFGCFRGEHDVDFTGLNGDLFAIAGPTGSGKSTVLDALTWALYGQTPRLGKHLNEHIFSPGESELSVVVEFAAGGDEYRATRSLRRRRSGISSAAKLERRAEDGRWLNVPETDRIADYERALARAVGLDYDGYVRAVMLPQGAFDEFLRGNDAERREVIKALLRAYTIERMRELASRERDDAKELLGQARARLDTEYEGVTREREAELEGRVRQLERDLAALRLEQREVQERLEGLAELERLDRELKAAAAELARLDAEEPAVEEARSALERADAAEALAPVIDAFRKRERELAEATRAVADLRERVRQEEGRLAAAKQRQEEAAAERAERGDELTRRAEALEAGRRDATLLRRYGGKLDMAGRADGGDFDEERLADLVEKRARLPALARAASAAESAEKELGERRAALERRRAGLESQRGELAALVEKGKRKRQELDAARDELERARVEHQAAALRAHLHVGEPCPVCLGVVESLPEAGAPVDLEALRARVERAQAEVDSLRDDYTAASQRIVSEEKAVAELAREVEQKHAPRAAQTARELREELAGFAGHGGTAGAVTADVTARADLELARLARRITALTGGRDFDALLAETNAALRRLDEAVEAAGRRLVEAEKDLAAARATLEATEQQEARAREAQTEAQAALEAALSRSRFDALASVEAATLTAEAASRLRERLERHAERRAAAEAKRSAAEVGLAGRTYDPEEHGTLREHAETLRGRIDEANNQLGMAGKELETLRRRLIDLAELRERAAELESRYAVLHGLEQSLRSHQFEAYVLGHALADLAANASVIINELTDGRYELDYDGEFYVRDTWMDPHRRTVKTLSGGESFIVSLALALALADSVAGQQRLGSLFLDEGFGTLDPEALDSVTEVLTNLTSNGRMV
ncbi:MAG TPA: SMC family ATPase, partial [Trueperaceae bacterium]